MAISATCVPPYSVRHLHSIPWCSFHLHGQIER